MYTEICNPSLSGAEPTPASGWMPSGKVVGVAGRAKGDQRSWVGCCVKVRGSEVREEGAEGVKARCCAEGRMR